jgi:large subunit ribosomal protein L9
VLLRQASEGGQLYGSVSPRDVAEAFTSKGFSLEKRQVVIDQAVKSLGLHKLRVVLHPEVSVSVTVNVARSEEEAERQTSAGTVPDAAAFFEEGAGPKAEEEAEAEDKPAT